MKKARKVEIESEDEAPAGRLFRRRRRRRVHSRARARARRRGRFGRALKRGGVARRRGKGRHIPLRLLIERRDRLEQLIGERQARGERG